MRTVPATPRLSPSVPFLLRHRARRRGPCHPQLLCYQRRYRFLVIRVTDTVGGRRTTPAVISPCSGTALTRLISRSTPYLTFLQHQHLLSVSALGRSRLDGPPVDRPDRPASPGRTGSLKLPAERLPKARVPGPETRDGLTALAAGAAIRPYPVPGGKRVSSCDRAPGPFRHRGPKPCDNGGFGPR